MNSKYCTYDSVNKILSGRPRQQIYNIDANLGYLFLQKLTQNLQNICQISADDGTILKNIDIYERSIKFAMHFQTLGIKQGDIVGLITSNNENLLPIIIACFTLGVAVNPLSIVMDKDDIIYMWSKIKPKLIFSEGKIIETVIKAIDSMNLSTKVFTMIDKVVNFEHADEILSINYEIEKFNIPDLENSSSTIAIISCSSGTTGASKAICKSHKQIIAQSFLMWDRSLKGDEILFNSIPPYWILHQLLLIFSILYDIPSVITSRKIEPEMWMDIIDRFKITVVFASPRFNSELLRSEKKRKLESIRYILMGGSTFNENLVTEMNKLLPHGKVLASYGLSEADAIAITSCEEGIYGLSSGYPYFNVSLKIVDENEISLGPNQIGEIYYKTLVPFSGYFEDKESTADVEAADGFFKSGDLGYFDECGRLYIIERIKNMIKCVGFKVVPVEIESIINEIDGVIQSCVVGIFDEKLFHERIHAFVVKNNSKTDLTEDFIRNYVNKKVIEVKQINGRVFFIDQIPLNSNGKILYRNLRNFALEKQNGKI